jgi:hypothetical protein
MPSAHSTSPEAATYGRIEAGAGVSVVSRRRAAAWATAIFVMLLALLWPALWNGFPIVFYDTGGYLNAYVSGLPVDGRSAIYGLFLWLGIPSDFWIDILFQAAVITWLLILTLRVHGFGGRPWLAAAVTVALGAFTSLPWYAAQLMPDIWLPAGVLALYLLAFCLTQLRRWEKIALGAVAAFAIAGHMATLALLAGLIAALALWRAVAPRLRWPRPALAAPALAAVAGVLLMLFANLALIGQFGLVPGGANFLFGRLIQTGIAARYLADHCPDQSLRLCAWRDRLPTNGDDWLWGEQSPLWQMKGGATGFEGEARRIVLDSLRDYPLRHVTAAVEGTLSQAVMVKTGDFLTPWNSHTRAMLKKYAPGAYPTFAAARQQQADFNFTGINAVHVPVALGAMAGLVVVVLLAWRGRWPRRHAAFALTLLVALLGNAVICGALSNPHDRYQSRLAALAPLALIIAVLGRRRPAE